MINVEDCLSIELESLMKYICQSKETLLVSVRNEGILKAEKKRKSKGRSEKNT